MSRYHYTKVVLNPSFELLFRFQTFICLSIPSFFLSFLLSFFLSFFLSLFLSVVLPFLLSFTFLFYLLPSSIYPVCRSDFKVLSLMFSLNRKIAREMATQKRKFSVAPFSSAAFKPIQLHFHANSVPLPNQSFSVTLSVWTHQTTALWQLSFMRQRGATPASYQRLYRI